MSSTDSILATAEAFWNANLSAIPAKNSKDGSLMPIKDWTSFCNNPPNQSEREKFRKLFASSHPVIYLACGRVFDEKRLVCIDVDDDRFVPVVEAVTGPIVSSRFGSKGIGIFVFVDKNEKLFKKYKKIDSSDGKQAIELLTINKGTVVPPSLHRTTGKAYQWRGEALHKVLHDLPTITIEKWRVLEAAVSSQEALGLLAGGETHNAVFQLLRKLACHTEDDDLIVSVVEALFGLSYRGRNNDPDEIRRILKGVRENYSDQLGSGFPPETYQRLIELNESHCVVSMGGKTVILQKDYDPELKRPCYYFWKYPDFKHFHLDDLVDVSKPGEARKLKGVGEIWFHWPKRAKADSLSLLPDHPTGLIEVKNKSIYNLWTGFLVEPKPGNWDTLKYHLKSVLCSDNEEHYKYLIGWLARCVQRPQDQAEVAVVLLGERGTGKGMFGRILSGIFGQHYFYTASQGLVAGRFNAHLRDTVVLFADEAFYAGDKKHQSVLKGIVTEEYLAIEAKFQNAVQVRNRLHLVMATNEAWAIPAGTDERRFFVLQVSNVHKQDHEYFAKVANAINPDVLSAMLHDLQAFDLKEFNVRDVPQTDALKGQKERSLSDVEDWVLSRLLEGVQTREHGEWSGWVATQALYEDFISYCKDKGSGYRLAVNVFSKELQGILRLKSARISGDNNGSRARGLVFPMLKDCRKDFERHVGYDIDWTENEIEDEENCF